MARKLSPPVFQGLPIASLLTPFVAYFRTARRSENTVAQYSWAVRSLDQYLQANGLPRSIAEVTAEHISAFQGHLLDARAQAAARSLRAF